MFYTFYLFKSCVVKEGSERVRVQRQRRNQTLLKRKIGGICWVFCENCKIANGMLLQIMGTRRSRKRSTMNGKIGKRWKKLSIVLELLTTMTTCTCSLYNLTNSFSKKASFISSNVLPCQIGWILPREAVTGWTKKKYWWIDNFKVSILVCYIQVCKNHENERTTVCIFSTECRSTASSYLVVWYQIQKFLLVVSVTRVTNLFHHMSKQVGTLQATVVRSTSQTWDCWRLGEKERMEVSKRTQKKGTVMLALQRIVCAARWFTIFPRRLRIALLKILITQPPAYKL